MERRDWLVVNFICAIALTTACGGSNSGGTGGTSGAAGTTGAAGTGTTAGTGGGGTAGTTTGGTGGASATGTGGGSATGTGGAPTGGSGGGGTGGGAGTGACAANTATDPQNCGACGHVCKSADAKFGGCPTGGCCTAGKCGAAPGACITQSAGFTTCNEYCTSLGETCVQGGCVRGNVTFESWSSTDQCESFFNSAPGFSTGPCEATIQFTTGTFRYVRCCCTDTH
jgi:hypothetical protein